MPLSPVRVLPLCAISPNKVIKKNTNMEKHVKSSKLDIVNPVLVSKHVVLHCGDGGGGGGRGYKQDSTASNASQNVLK